LTGFTVLVTILTHGVFQFLLNRSTEEEKADARIFDTKRHNVHLKKKLLPSLFVDNTEDQLEDEQRRKSKKSKKRKRREKANMGESSEVAVEHEEAQGEAEPAAKKARKKNRRKKKSDSGEHEATKPATSSGTSATVTAKPYGSSKQRTLPSTKKKDAVNADVKMSDNRLEAYGINPNKFKRKARKDQFKAKSVASQ
jgi:hypothetical protein